MAIALTAVAPANADDHAKAKPIPIETSAPVMTPDQKAQYEAWPPDKQATFDGWSEEAKGYFWSLNPSRQDYFWILSEEDRATLLAMEPVEREEAWQRVEGRGTEAPPPEPEG